MFLLATVSALTMPFNAAALDSRELLPHTVMECFILDSSGKVIRSFDGTLCIFLPDGSVISGNQKRLIFYNPDMTIKWEKVLEVHHQLNLSPDKKRILTMTSSFHNIDKKKVRFDKLIIFDFDGKEIFSFDTFDHQKDLHALTKMSERKKLNTVKPKRDKIWLNPDATWEFSHMNSFYEIQDNSLSEKNPIFTKGNFLVNDKWLNVIFILDAHLKKILWSTTAPALRIHDVQLQANGWMLYYENKHPKYNHSTIAEFDPIQQIRREVYVASPPNSFNSPIAGGVQRLAGGHLLISDITNGGYAHEINDKGNIIWSIPHPLISPVTKRRQVYQQARQFNLTDFLNNNRGL